MSKKIALLMFQLLAININGGAKKIKSADEISKDGVAVVKVYADWCGYCKMIAKDYDALADELADVAEVDSLQDVDAKEFAKKHKIGGYPTFLVFKDGEVFATIQGGDLDGIRQAVNKAKGGKAPAKKEAPAKPAKKAAPKKAAPVKKEAPAKKAAPVKAEPKKRAMPEKKKVERKSPKKAKKEHEKQQVGQGCKNESCGNCMADEACATC